MWRARLRACETILWCLPHVPVFVDDKILACGDMNLRMN
jgi:hypothetical protein